MLELHQGLDILGMLTKSAEAGMKKKSWNILLSMLLALYIQSPDKG